MGRKNLGKMTSEIITTKRDTEIGRLLERVIRDHRKDISAYSKGSSCFKCFEYQIFVEVACSADATDLSYNSNYLFK